MTEITTPTTWLAVLDSRNGRLLEARRAPPGRLHLARVDAQSLRHPLGEDRLAGTEGAIEQQTAAWLELTCQPDADSVRFGDARRPPDPHALASLS